MGFWFLQYDDEGGATGVSGSDTGTLTSASAVLVTPYSTLPGPLGVPVIGPVGDTGTGTEGISSVQILRTPVSASDTGSGAETSSVTVFSFVPEAGSDTGSFSESSSIQITVLFASVAVSDVGTAVDGATVVVLGTAGSSTSDSRHQGQISRGYGGRIGGGNQGRVKITA